MNSTVWASATPLRSPPSTATARASCWTACVEHFPQETAGGGRPDIIKVAIVGKPNVGKSSLLNRILGEERVIVSNVAGHHAGRHRHAILKTNRAATCFIDTAGMRRKSKVDDAIETLFQHALHPAPSTAADVCLILIDANEGVTEQDTKIAGLAHEAGKAVHHRGQQMGHRRKRRPTPWTRIRTPSPPGPQLYDLCARCCSSPP